MSNAATATSTSGARIAAVAVLAVVAAYAIVRNATITLFGERAPAVALSLPPTYPDALIAEAMPQSDGRRAAPQPDLPALRRALSIAPLAAEPLYALARDAERDGDRIRALTLMEAARRRAPRWSAPRLWLIQEYLRASRIDDAVGEIATLLRVRPQAEAQLFSGLLLLSSDPAARPALDRTLAQNPAWRSSFIRFASERDVDPSALFASVLAGADSVPPPNRRAEQSAFIDLLITRNELDRAYLAWINFLPPSAIGAAARVFDGRFSVTEAPPPFAWTLADGTAASTDRIDDAGRPGLQFSYFGPDDAQIATQMLLLPPGTQTFRFKSRVRAGSEFGGAVRWRLTCVGSQRPVAEIPVTASEAVRDTRVAITVPATGCGAQQLVLAGVAGEFASVVEGFVTDVAVD